MYLTVPIPFNKLKTREINVQRWDPQEQRIKVQVQYTASSSYADIKKKVSDLCGIPSHLVRRVLLVLLVLPYASLTDIAHISTALDYRRVQPQILDLSFQY